MLIGVDIGGTFTDFVVSEDGELRIHKRLSTPSDPAEAMLAGLAVLGAAEDARLSHGTTVATNAILERKGARTALITTQGFRDILAIGRQNRPQLYALQPQLPPPLIPRQWCYEVPERLDFQGNVLIPLDIDALDAVIDALAEARIEAVAISFLYSFLNPHHEQAARKRILERGVLEEWQISLSSEVLPQFREYERTSTTALDAYVRPVISRYLSRLEERLPTRSRLLVMKSDGGVISANRARQQAIHTALSGPAAGVIGAFYLAQLAGYEQIITMDIGGTSTDVALCPRAPTRRTESEIDGLPLRTPMIDIETVGAGGGSLARVDAGGALRVGPESAGAAPGPIIYGRGGEHITVSDANAIVGRLDPAYFLGGGMALHLEPARRALDELARQMQLSREAAALGILDVANTNIDRAIRRVSVARGYDPRQFTLMAFGGAGPLHACEVAERLEIPRVLIPRYPGVLCALGLLVADVQRDYSRAVLQAAAPRLYADLKMQAEALIAQARHDLAAEGLAESQMLFLPVVDMRYQGQSYELSVPFDEHMVERFHAAHEHSYGHAMPHRTAEVVNLRLQAIGKVEKPPIHPDPLVQSDGSEALLGYKLAFFRAGEGQIALYNRERLLPGAQLSAPALIFQLDSTTFVPPNWSIRVDGYHNLILEYQPS